MKRSEERANEWMEEQEASPRPGSSGTKTYIPKGVALNPIVKMVKPESLKPNPRNDFEHLSEEEYASLKENIALNGILDALTARKDGTIITGENRYRIALELKDHKDEEVRRRVESIPVRYYMNELTAEEEYDILEGDNLFRRHLTSEQRKERLKRRILRKYKDDLILDNRGGDRKSEQSKVEDVVTLLVEGSKEESESLNEEAGQESNLLLEGLKSLDSSQAGSKIQGESLIFSKKEQPENLAVKISKNENIPKGTAQRYIAELRKELKSKDSKSSLKKEKGKKETKKNVPKPKDKVKEFQKKYSKMSAASKKTELNRLVSKVVGIRKKRTRLEEQIAEILREDLEIVAKLESVGEKKRVQGI
ncbi:ParB N-terminal domain-containing protein [Leptospira kirschneri]|uniref:ParB-like protein n=1 Tax=Leptospira kirschneri str. 200802841 TaxID=1193047 RepID=A0A828YB64_9LEPT|nr:ParB N-terminal domain-containing protein [Leptospira kirschneri]EKO53933.1 ParB-like protein [Leptospira kirschneri str. 200802841]